MKSVLSILFTLSLANLASAVPDFASFVEEHCAECHDAATRKGNLDLVALLDQPMNADHLARWVSAHDRVRAGEMPPKKNAQPAPETRASFLSSLRASLMEAEAKQPVAVVRRMNRVEYESTLRDLLHLPLLRVKDLLPEDGQQAGFDKVGGALDFSPVLVSKYMLAADAALNRALVKESKRPETRIWREPAAKQDTVRGAIAVHCAVPLKGRDLAPGLTTSIVGNPEKDLGNTYRAAHFNGEADSVALLTGVIGAHQPQGLQPDRFKPPVSGWYRVKFSVWSLRWMRTHAEPARRGLVRCFTSFDKPFFKNASGKWEYTRLPESQPMPGWMENVEFYGDAEVTQIVRASLNGEPIGYFDAPSLEPKVHEFKAWLNPGEKVSFHAMTLPATGAKNSGSNEGVRDYEGPAVAFDWFEVEGPLVDEWPPGSQRRLFGEVPESEYPRPMLDGAPAIKPGQPAKLPLNAFKEAGAMLGAERYLNVNGATTLTINCSVAGEYEMAVTAYETRAGDESAKMYLMLGDQEMPHARFTVKALRDAPQTHRAKFRVSSAGPVTVGVQFVNDFLDEKNPDPRLRDRNLFLTSIEVTPPKASPAAEDKAAPADAHRGLLLDFANSAFRRPVKSEELAAYAAIVETELKRGARFAEAMLAGYKAILCSPDFLVLGLEPGDYALASRLSYFLWNAPPDDELLQLAAKGELTKPETRRKQVRRMLADPRSERFVVHFLDEWLELKKIDFTTPDPALYPEYDPWLHDSMLAETRGYFRRMLERDLGVRGLIQDDTVFVNQRLAELYGLRGVTGSEFREVKLPSGSPRGGLLTQASVLKVTANGTATSPVLRGVWVMERILGIPRQPPPPNIPAIEPDATGAVTVRQMIEKHRADPACASCHAKMDPPGLALENFDAIGGWRDFYRLAGQPKKIRVGKGKEAKMVEEPSIEIVSDSALRRNRVKMRLGPPVDASGELADGRTFEDIGELRALLLKDEDALARNVVRQLMTYATGRAPRFTDREQIDAIVSQTQSSRHGLRNLVEHVVTSPLFVK